MTDAELLQPADEELIRRIRTGDGEAERVLYDRYKRVVRSRARAYFLVGADREDLIQEGMIGLYKAVCDYAFDRQVSFFAFAELCITRQMISAIKGATRKKHLPLNTYVSLNRSVFEGDSERTLMDMLASVRVSDPEETLLRNEREKALAQTMLSELTRLEQEALERYLRGDSYQQIALALGRSVKSVDNAIQRVRKKLEAHLGAGTY